VRNDPGYLVANPLALVSELVDGLANAGVDLVESFGGSLAEASGRISEALTKLRRASGSEPQREASADERACQQSKREAVVTMFLCLCVHV